MTLISNTVQLKTDAPLGYSLTGQTTLTLPSGAVATFAHMLHNNTAEPIQLWLQGVQNTGGNFSLENLQIVRGSTLSAQALQTSAQFNKTNTAMISASAVNHLSLSGGETVYINVSGVVPAASRPKHWSSFSMLAGAVNDDSVIVRPDLVIVRDHTPGSGLFVEKQVSKPEAEIGDTVEYAVQVKTVSDVMYANTQLTDHFPFGFTFVPKSLRINDFAQADPSLTSGGFALSLRMLQPATITTVKYRLRLGAAALRGDGNNRAIATNADYASNTAIAHVEVREGVFTSRGIILGRVFCDANGNGRPDLGETGVPGVRVYLEDATYTVTDANGRYSFYGLRPTTHVLKIDRTTLPKGSEVAENSQLQAGHVTSRFVFLKRFEMHKANFAIKANTEARAEIESRRSFLRENETEIASNLQDRLTPDGALIAISDPKALPSSGTIKSNALPNGLDLPETKKPKSADAPTKPTTPAGSKPPSDDELVTLTNQFGFANLKDGAVLPSTELNVRVKGPLGARFTLAVNGSLIGEKQLAQKAAIASRQLEVWDYVGLTLAPGKNRIRVTMTDPFGNPRGNVALNVIAPGRLALIKVTPLKEFGIADGTTPSLFRVELLDARGTPVMTRTSITLSSKLGQWKNDSFHPTPSGTDVFLEGGQETYALIPPSETGTTSITISSGNVHTDLEYSFRPDLRPMIVNGVIEGILHLGSGQRSGILSADAHDAFENELETLSATSHAGRLGVGSRAAFFLKGKIRGDYLLTAAYDSDKPTKERLFRDIQPDEFYPVYGDSSVRGFDAQSSGKLYVRLDNGRSYLLLGDFTTQTTIADSDDSRALGNYQRSLTGLREHYETSRVKANVWASQDSSRQIIQEIPANGTSGPFTFSTANVVENSERLEILVRDRDQPSRILSIRVLSRFFDYEFEPYTGDLLLKAPVPTLDPDLNPYSIRITCEVDTGGKAFWTYGADAEVHATKGLTLSGGLARNEDPSATTQLSSAGGSYKLDSKDTVLGEVAQRRSDVDGTGYAERIDFKRHDGNFDLHSYLGCADLAFQNPASLLLPGHIEGGFDFHYKWTPTTTVVGRGIVSEDLADDGQRNGAQLDVERAIGRWKFDVGARYSEESTIPASTSSEGATPNTVESLRTKITAPVPKLKSAFAYLEYEQDVRNDEKRMAAAGFDYHFDSGGRFYGRHEFISSLGGPFELNDTQTQHTTVLGFERDYMKNGQTFDEYRTSNEIDGRQSEAAIGLRNLWNLGDGVRARTTFEKITPVSGDEAEKNASLATTAAVEYSRSQYWKADARFEYRYSPSVDTVLNTLGYAHQLSTDWTFLGKSVLLLTEEKDVTNGGKDLQGRLQAGFAWRPSNNDRWNALGKYELRYESDDRPTATFSHRFAHVVNTDLNYQPTDRLTLSLHYAGKYVAESGTTSDLSRYTAHLLGGHTSWELNRLWDIGWNAYVLVDQSSHQTSFAFGPEVGLIVHRNLSVGLGYNFAGFRDHDLAADGANVQGVFIRMRLKFDEESLPFSQRKDHSG